MSLHRRSNSRRPPLEKHPDLLDTVEYVPPAAQPLAPGETVLDLLREYEKARAEARWSDHQAIWGRLRELAKRPQRRRGADGA